MSVLYDLESGEHRKHIFGTIMILYLTKHKIDLLFTITSILKTGVS